MNMPLQQNRNIKPKYQISYSSEEVERVITQIVDGQFVNKTITEPLGFMVYLPSGASMRARTVKQLREIGIDPDDTPTLIDMDTGEEIPMPSVVDLRGEIEGKSASTRGSRRSGKSSSTDDE